MQIDFDTNHPELQIQLLSINEWGRESMNEVAASGRDIPLLQDVDSNGDFQSDVWASWDVEWRDVVIVDANSDAVTTFNLTTNDLRTSDNYDELKQLILDAAATAPVAPITGDCTEDGLLTSDDLACVTHIEERDAVLDAVDTLPGDLDGSGGVAFADFLVLSNNFGKDVASYSDGDIDLNGAVDFADFLVLSNNFGATANAQSDSAASVDTSSTDAFFIALAEDDRDDE